jgi:hypothetical protein
MRGGVERDKENNGEWRNLNKEWSENCTHTTLSVGSLMVINCRKDLDLEAGGFYG